MASLVEEVSIQDSQKQNSGVGNLEDFTLAEETDGKQRQHQKELGISLHPIFRANG